MTTADLLLAIQEDGLSLELATDGTLRARGPGPAVARWAPAVKEHKAALVELLTPRRRWLIHLPDGWRDSTFTPPASLAEVRAWYPEALEVEPEEDTHEGEEPAPDSDLEALPDDRITCRQCRHLSGARCQAALRGLFQHRARRYEPPPERRHACHAFAPLSDDSDQRPGTARWPGLAWMMRNPT